MLVPVKAKITRDQFTLPRRGCPTLEPDLGRKLEGECLVVLAHGAKHSPNVYRTAVKTGGPDGGVPGC